MDRTLVYETNNASPILAEGTKDYMQHDDLTAESIAEIWHKIAMAISIAAAISGIGIVITAGAGAFWHRWAIEQHRIEIDRLNKEKI
jgi:hypothetical protein